MEVGALELPPAREEMTIPVRVPVSPVRVSVSPVRVSSSSAFPLIHPTRLSNPTLGLAQSGKR